MSLIAETKSLDCGLFRGRECGSSIGQIKDVTMPVSCNKLARQPSHQAVVARRIGQPHKVPADFASFGTPDLPAQDRGQQLGAQTNTKNRLVVAQGTLDKVHFDAQVRVTVELVNALRPAHNDYTISRLHLARNPLVSEDSHVLPLKPGLLERLSDPSEVLDRMMLQDPNFTHGITSFPSFGEGAILIPAFRALTLPAL